MAKYKIKFAIVLISAMAAALSAETWQFKEGKELEIISEKAPDRYLQAVTHIKKLVNEGKSRQTANAYNDLKKNFPDIAGPDLDAFSKAEILLAKGKITKAAENYEKFLSNFPESKLYDAALDRQFAIATAFLAGQKKTVLKIFRIKGYAEGEKIMGKITDRAGKAPIGAKAALAVAKSYEKRKKFADAYRQWSLISSRWTTGRIGEDSLLGVARCRHAAYKGPKFDASNLVSAKTYYENFKLRYPQNAGTIDIADKLEQIEEQLAYKQFTIGQYYQRTGSDQPAQSYYQMVMDNWPQTTVAKMAKAAMENKKSGDKEDMGWKKNIMKKLEKLFL